jgi:excisionase family DNA binding protein
MRTAHRPETMDGEAPTGVFVRPHPNLWDANDVARYLKVSRSWVYHRAEAGLLPLRRVGGLLRFDPAAIRAFAAGPAPEKGEGGRRVAENLTGRRSPR